MASVILDAGHGGYDRGASFEGRNEKDDTLNLTLAVGEILRNNGVEILFTRTDDVYQSPAQKAQIANASRGDFFVSIHRNSGVQPNQYSGVQTLVFRDQGVPAIFAENINRELAEVGFNNIGVEERTNLAVLRRTAMPAVLVEAGFINSDVDNEIFDSQFQQMAQAIADGILQSIQEVEGGMRGAGEDADGMAATPILYEDRINDISEAYEEVMATSSEQGVYSIEVGEFRHLENAQELARIMQENGYSSYIQDRSPYYVVGHGRFQTRNECEKMEQKLYQEGYETRIVSNMYLNNSN